MSGYTRRFCVAAAVLFAACVLPLSAQEKEPNDQPEKANPIKLNQAIVGTVHQMDGHDYYALTLPESGIVTVTLSKFPDDCKFQVGVMGFQKYATSAAGWVFGDPGKPITCSFVGQGKLQGYIWVRLESQFAGLATNDWAGVQCVKGGPWHVKPWVDKPYKNVPAMYEGAKVLGPITYELKVTHQAVSDAYEPNFEPTMNRDDMFKKGIIKTIPIGKPITACLFNDAPGFLRGTKGNEDARGGEDDIDTYHVRLDAPDKVTATVTDLPEKANLKIIIYHKNGWEESKAGQATVTADVKAAGDVFIELSKGRENRPLVYSVKPYKLLVTTGRTAGQPETGVVKTGGTVGTVSTGAVGQETEPNDRPDKANPIQLDGAMVGMWNAGDQYDYYKLTLPSSGIVTVNLSGYPADAIFQVGITGFQKHETSEGGWAKNVAGKPLTFSFVAQGGKPGCVWVRLSNVASATASGDWSAVQCSKTGPWYFTPKPGQADAKLPGAYEGSPMQGPIKYELKLAFKPMVDEYEPNFEAGVKREDLLKQGLIKTIPVGQEIKALLFNDYPAVMRGAPGNENASGGEDDIDFYHVRLAAPDKVKVTLSALPEKANVKLIIYHPNGWNEAKAGENSVVADVKAAGDVFIEVSKGHDNRPLGWSAEPYKLLVRTGAQPAAGGGETKLTPMTAEIKPGKFEELMADRNKIDPFPDELEVMKKYAADPSEANRVALVKIRFGYAVALAREAERTTDEAMYTRALCCAESGLALDKDNPVAWALVGRIYSGLRYSRAALIRAEEALREALRLQDDPGVHVLLGQALFHQDRYKVALEEFEKGVAGNPKLLQPPLMVMMCSAYALELRPDAGVKFFQGVLKKDPRADSARMCLALLLKQEGNEKDAVAELQKVVRRDGASIENQQYALEIIKRWKEEKK